jgi:hypothetical protein
MSQTSIVLFAIAAVAAWFAIGVFIVTSFVKRWGDKYGEYVMALYVIVTCSLLGWAVR